MTTTLMKSRKRRGRGGLLDKTKAEILARLVTGIICNLSTVGSASRAALRHQLTPVLITPVGAKLRSYIDHCRDRYSPPATGSFLPIRWHLFDCVSDVARDRRQASGSISQERRIGALEGAKIEAYSVAFLRWHRGYRLRHELNGLLQKLNRDHKAELRQSAAHHFRDVISQIAVAEHKSPGDREAVLGVLVQLVAAVEHRRAEMKKSEIRDELVDLPLRLVSPYLKTRIDAERNQISREHASRILGILESALLIP